MNLVSRSNHGLQLGNLDEAMRFASMVAGSEFAPKEFRQKPESCLLAMQHGAEIGLGPMQSLQSIAVINGRPSVYGDAALALVRSSHACEYVTETISGEGDKMAATCIAKRKNNPECSTTTFSVADAKRAGLWGKSGPWSQYPQRMLQMRARGFCLRDAFPDVLRGLITREEAQDIPIDLTAHVVPTAAPAPESTLAVEERLPSITILKISELFKQSGLDADAWRHVLAAYNVTRTHQLTPAQAEEVIKHMVSIIEERDAIKTEGGAA